MMDALRLACPLAILATTLLPAIAYSGDEDTKPAYMIYIDPETGKYTSEDPYADNTNDGVARAEPASGDARPNLPLLIVGGGALAVLLVGVLLNHQRRQLLRQ